jgi:hypothetical protein
MMIKQFLIDPHALRYFGIIRLLDMPGYFPTLALPDNDHPTPTQEA